MLCRLLASITNRGGSRFFHWAAETANPSTDRGCPVRLGFECLPTGGAFWNRNTKTKDESRNGLQMCQVRSCPCLSDGKDHGAARRCSEHFIPAAMSELRTVRCLLYHKASGGGLLESWTIYTTERTQKMTPEQLMGFAALIVVALYVYHLTITPKL